MPPRRPAALFLAACLIAAGVVAAPTDHVLAQGEATVSAPTLYFTPECLVGGETAVHVHGRNFSRNAAIEVWDLFNYDDFSYGISVGVISDDYGNIEATIDLGVSDTPWHTIVATPFNSKDRLATAYLGKCYPHVTANPGCGDEPFSVDVSGTYWADGSITVLIYPPGGGENLAYREFPVTGGRFAGTVPVPGGLAAGTYSILANQVTEIDPFDPHPYMEFTRFTVPCPHVTIEPICARSGSPPDTWSLLVTLDNFIDGDGFTSTEIVFDPVVEPQEFVTPFPNGAFLITPLRRPKGAYAVIAKQGYSSGFVFDEGADLIPAQTGRAVEQVRLTFTTPCPTSPTPSASPSPGRTTLLLSPDCGPPHVEGDVAVSHFVTVTGEGFRPGAVTLTYDPGGAAEQSFDASAAADGSFRRQLPIRAGPDGRFRLVAHQDAIGDFIPDAEATYTAPCTSPEPSVVVDPACGVAAAGSAAAYEINVTGAGFLPGHVDITFDPAGLAPFPAPPASADAAGNFRTLLRAPGRGPGNYLVAAHQRVSGSDTVVDASGAFVVSCEGPSLLLLPASARRGTVVMVQGHSFPPDADLLLLWDLGIGTSQPIAVRTDGNGDFTRQVLIFRTDFIGPRLMAVQLAADPLALANLAPAPLFVLPGTVSPPFSLADNPYAAPGATIVIRH